MSTPVSLFIADEYNNNPRRPDIWRECLIIGLKILVCRRPSTRRRLQWQLRSPTHHRYVRDDFIKMLRSINTNR